MRERWTKEQKQFLVGLGKTHRTTAGELLRHILAWYLIDGRQIARPVESRPDPAAWIPLPKETGLMLLDFLATPDQVKALKEAVAHSGLGEAAYLRRAVDVYREHGPLIVKKP